jgi:hypothetical protein
VVPYRSCKEGIRLGWRESGLVKRWACGLGSRQGLFNEDVKGVAGICVGFVLCYQNPNMTQTHKFVFVFCVCVFVYIRTYPLKRVEVKDKTR